MVIDHLKNAKIYSGLHPNITYALQYLETNPVADLEPGKYEIQGSDIFLLVQSYDTRSVEESFWEAHSDYTDIQYMIEGTELMGYAHSRSLTITEDHLADKDYMVLEGKGDFMEVREGSFVIFFPEDAHMPCLAVDKPKRIKKAVMKVRLSVIIDENVT
jgi:YhcH/YjgK/YiaL family protein